jgi:hypothetical protein
MSSAMALVGSWVAGTTIWLAEPVDEDGTKGNIEADPRAVSPPAGNTPASEGSAPPASGSPPASGAASAEGGPAEDPTVDPTTDAAVDAPPAEDAAATPEPAPLPPKGPPPPKPSEPRAWGGAFHAPLPQPPAKVDPSLLGTEPWRGRFWLGVGLAVSIPLGGRPPAAGGVISAVGGIGLGWRVNRYLGLFTSLSTFAHDAGQRTVVASDGTPYQVQDLGRITAFDLVTARVFVPAHRRIEPWAEVGAGVGARRGAFALHREAVGQVRVDFWLAPKLTFGVATAYRTTILGDAVGHGLRAGADLGLHW